MPRPPVPSHGALPRPLLPQPRVPPARHLLEIALARCPVSFSIAPCSISPLCRVPWHLRAPRAPLPPAWIRPSFWQLATPLPLLLPRQRASSAKSSLARPGWHSSPCAQLRAPLCRSVLAVARAQLPYARLAWSSRSLARVFSMATRTSSSTLWCRTRASCSPLLGLCSPSACVELLCCVRESVVCAKFSACNGVSSFRVELLSSVPVVVSEPILGCRSIFSYPAASVVVKCVCCRELACGAHSVSGPRFLQLGQAGHRSVLCSPKSLPSNHRSRSTRQSHLGRLSIFYLPWYNTTIRSDLQTAMASVVLCSQPDLSVRSLFVHRASRVLAFIVGLLNPSFLACDFVIARALTGFVSSPAHSKFGLVVVPCVIKKSQESGEDEASRVIFTKYSTKARTSRRSTSSSTPSP
ncbi:uncharacterized protein [Zea mays]|uniref:uncharacterized protein n=1 Tax=Zea mays TaxID=4577 RepID=UPI0004DE8040|nr:uncharacterized protein LOC118472930 [Zea mays]